MENRLENLKERLEAYKRAELAILDGAQTYSLGSRSLTRANLAEVTEMIGYLEKQVEIETAKSKGKGKMRVLGGVPRDI